MRHLFYKNRAALKIWCEVSHNPGYLCPFGIAQFFSRVNFCMPEKSYVIGFDMLLRFRDVRKAGDSNGKN